MPTPNLKDLPRRAFGSYQEQTGQSLKLWAFLALTSFITQIVLRHELAPGEFGTLNTVFGVIGLMCVPLVAVIQTFTWYLALNHAPERRERIDSLRSATVLVTEMFAWAWAGVAGLLLLLALPLVELPRLSLHLFTLIAVLIALGGVLSGAVYSDEKQLRLWIWLLGIAAVARLILSAWLGWSQPWAESGLAAFLIAGLITFAPALRPTEAEESQRMKALRAVWDRDFLLNLSATFSVLLALFLFSSADRIVAQSWFGAPTNNNFGYVDWRMFDAYQTAGLIGRSLLWGTQPLLLILYAQRSLLDRSTPASIRWFWIYLGALLAGVIFVELFRLPLSWLFCGRDLLYTSHLVPIFALAMVPLGLLQGLGMFALASRRYPECFVLGGCSIGYTLLLYLAGRQAVLMPAYMFGGGLVALMILLFVGVVRWGRKQP